jgi:predicted enzyme related to lactoylglutathione lyase
MGNLEPLARTYPPGVTSWVEVLLADVGAGKAFYGGLFGWRFDGLVATLDGLDVASVGEAGSGPAAWATYVAVDDADAMTRTMVALGAELVAPPEDASPAGRAATLRDPQGAEVRLWQARERLGAQLTNSPGAWNFSDLHTADPTAAARFYCEVFGWRVVDQGWGVAIQVPGYGDHLESTVDPDIRSRQDSAPDGFEDVIGGLAPAEEGEPSHWHVTFTVADRDSSADLVERLGGRVVRRGEDDWTRSALVQDPQGVSFTISQFAPQEWS